MSRMGSWSGRSRRAEGGRRKKGWGEAAPGRGGRAERFQLPMRRLRETLFHTTLERSVVDLILHLQFQSVRVSGFHVARSLDLDTLTSGILEN